MTKRIKKELHVQFRFRLKGLRDSEEGDGCRNLSEGNWKWHP